MKVIALRGSENTGKSHAINIAYAFLLRDGWRQVPENFRILGNPKFEDVFDVLERGGSRLGIIGMGDYQRGANALGALIEEIRQRRCVIVVCACRTTPAIERQVSRYPGHQFVDKTLSFGGDNHRIVNTIDAQRIIDLITI